MHVNRYCACPDVLKVNVVRSMAGDEFHKDGARSSDLPSGTTINCLDEEGQYFKPGKS